MINSRRNFEEFFRNFSKYIKFQYNFRIQGYSRVAGHHKLVVFIYIYIYIYILQQNLFLILYLTNNFLIL